MLTVTLAQLQAEVQKRADLQNSLAFAPLADITEYINRAWARLYGKLSRAGENYYLRVAQWTTTSQQQWYYTTAATVGIDGNSPPAGTTVLPTTIYLVKGVDAQVQTNRWLNCERFNWERRNDYQQSDWYWPIMTSLYDYQGSGASAAIFLMPPPAGNIPMRVWYYPEPVVLVNGTDTVDTGNRWDSYVIDWATRLLAEKDENWDLCTRLDASIMKLESEILAEIANRNAGQAPKIRRHRYRRGGWPWGLPGGIP